MRFSELWELITGLWVILVGACMAAYFVQSHVPVMVGASSIIATMGAFITYSAFVFYRLDRDPYTLKKIN